MEERLQQFTQLLSSCHGLQDFNRLLIVQSRNLVPASCQLRTSAYAVPGCLVPLWLRVEWRDEVIYAEGDSDSRLARGFLHLLIQLFSGLNRQEAASLCQALATDAGFSTFRNFGHNRNNNLGHLWEFFRQACC